MLCCDVRSDAPVFTLKAHDGAVAGTTVLFTSKVLFTNTEFPFFKTEAQVVSLSLFCLLLFAHSFKAHSIT